MKSIFSLLTALFIFVQVQSSFAQTTEQLVKNSFDNYKKAILTDDAKAALAEIDSRTKRYYQDLLAKTKTLDSTEVDKLSVIDKFTLLVIRHKLSKEEILKMTDHDLFLYAIELY